MPFTLNDFKMDLRKCLTPKNHIWAASGSSVCAPVNGTVTGVKGCYSPPFSAPDTVFNTQFTVNGHVIPDNGSTGKGDCGLLYSGGDWLPGKIIRRGTYHFNADGKLLSIEVTGEMVPLFGTPGFAISISVTNRADEETLVSVTPMLDTGNPIIVPLGEWEFTPPKEGKRAECFMLTESNDMTLKKSETGIFRFAVIFTESGVKSPSYSIQDLISKAEARWAGLIELASSKLPAFKSDIPGLQAYYERSLISGLVSLWENDSYITNPFPATSGVDGGSICCYPWDVAGYSARTLSMLLGEKSLDFFKALLDSGIDKHISMALDGGGLGWCAYSYSCWSLVNLYSEILRYCGKGYELFDDMIRIFEQEEERLPEWEHLKDYGGQQNLLEMRTCGYEYYVASPNAERAWCYDRLADIGKSLGRDMNEWHKKADLIRKSIVKNLWDKETGWFKCVHPEGHTEIVYSIQAFDALKCGVCDDGMKAALLKHLRDGAFLGKYGVSSVSAEDKLHYELNDPDWSGGGAYSGDGPELAETLWQQNEPGVAWDVLRRHLWMGEHLLYYPQEHFCDIPGVPANKRANIIAGVAGVHALLFGMAGIDPSLDGFISINPSVPDEGFVEITGFKFREMCLDITMKPGYIKVVLNGDMVYEGKPKTIKL